MSGYAVAVHTRPSRVLLAAADARGVRLLAAVPAGTGPADAVAALFGDDPPAVVVPVGTTPGGPFPGAPRVLPVPAAVAVLAVGPAPGAGPVLVVDDAGEVLVQDGVPVAGPRTPAGIVLAGDRVAADPGRVAAAARGARCPVRVAGPAGPGDPADVPGAGPDTAAVLGAALLGAALLDSALLDSALPDPADAGVAGPPTGTAPTGTAPTGTAPTRTAPGAEPPDRGRYLVAVLALLGAALVLAGTLLGGAGPEDGAGTAPAGVVVQYGYRAAVPAGWEHTGGDPIRRRVLLTPADRPDGADLVVVERSPLGFDADREPARARRELTALLAGRGLGPPTASTVAGRPVLGYLQRPGDGTVVAWHVLFDGDDELAVGCRRPEHARPDPACAAVVGSVRPHE